MRSRRSCEAGTKSLHRLAPLAGGRHLPATRSGADEFDHSTSLGDPVRVVRSVSTIVCVAALATGAQHAQGAPAPVAESVTIARAPGQLAGSLLVPHAGTPTPVVLLISGSGPTDRDGNGPGIAPASLRQLAESLATRGIATLRFDKRVVGGSLSAMLPEAQLSFELLAEDVAGWRRFLAGDRRFSPVIVAGHSEGALLGLLAMHDAPAAGYVSIAGPDMAAQLASYRAPDTPLAAGLVDAIADFVKTEPR